MKLKKIIEADDAVAVIHHGDVIASAGYGGNGTPDQLLVAGTAFPEHRRAT
ncbi:hypothetical protein [Accumulibacter sp.]|uniref:hypothetical protein n=1 Tax=Accumulibacter sp. TaxID=2053492 RepID=UPI0025D0B371|nr:hypothetical protein [Accumulibacter sp.]